MKWVMTDRDPPPPKSAEQRRREQRLAAALRANLKRRKQTAPADSKAGTETSPNDRNLPGKPGGDGDA